MFVSARYDRTQGWLVGENEALLIPELREVLLDESLGVHAIATIVLAADPDSFLAPVFTDEHNRLKEAEKCVYEADTKKIEEVECQQKFHKALAKYKSLCDTPANKIRKQFQTALANAGTFIEDKSSNLNEDNFKDFIGSLTDMPKLLTAFSEMNNQKKDDVEEVKSRVRGNKELSYRAKKLRSKTK